jgi:hypothetical protein
MADLSKSSQKQFAEILQENFPWLGTDEPVDGPDTIEQLVSLWESLTEGK